MGKAKKTRTMKEILLANKKLKGNAHAQIAHLVFANTQAKPKKPKELFFSQRTGDNAEEKVSLKTNKRN